MSRVFLTGDKHGSFSPQDYEKIRKFCELFETTTDDAMIVLGDHGTIYDSGEHDDDVVASLSTFPITFFFLRGNHDRRVPENWEHIYLMAAHTPGNIRGPVQKHPASENLYYLPDTHPMSINGWMSMMIGGAYSVDRPLRLLKTSQGHRGWLWFEDEQLTQQERDDVDLMLDVVLTEMKKDEPHPPILILSHTCPLRHKPLGLPALPYLFGNPDETMERWLNTVEDKLIAADVDWSWYCGHWHIDQKDGPLRFMFHDILELKPPCRKGDRQ